MIFKYLEFGPNVFRPVIPVILKSPAKFMIYSALIDSGADNCIFSLDIADLLHIKPKTKDKTQFIGVGKDTVNGYFSTIELRIGDIFYQTKVIFADMSDFGHGILGQKGFFDHFDVKLSYNKQIIEIDSLKQTSN
ncbi:MAG: retropepsin-like domain-containing protein [Candidatus Levybacteria bacterium]|nr:retropepsin-like domain-containing protein [Candidatus Levybacteria bacterium]